MAARINRFILVLIMLARLPDAEAANPVPVQPPGYARVAAVMEMLVPGGRVVPPASDRLFWEKARQVPYLADHVRRAEDAMDLVPPSPEAWLDAYLEFSRSGNRNRWESLVGPAKDSLRILALAECLEDGGRFLPVLEKRIREFCGWPTWVSCAHDAELANVQGTRTQIDLMSTQLAADLSSCLMLFGDRLSPGVRELLVQNLRERILLPFKRQMTGEQEPDFWLTTTNNWNAVCLSGVLVTALGASENPRELAWMIAAGERMIGNFLAGFSAHGYCSEGLAYWGYGYGHFITLAEYARRATGGALDLMDSAQARSAALFPFGIHILDGVYPAFADCPVDAGLPQTWAWYVLRRMGLEDPAFELTKHPSAEAFYLYGRLLFVDPEAVPAAGPGDGRAAFDPLRRYFPDAGVLVSRAPGPRGFGMAVKAGHNGEHHNHNDVGTFVIASRGEPVLCDPGKEHYTRDTFSGRRYLSPVHNSFGHAVPVVNGQLQQTGEGFAGRIVEEDFTAARDRIVIDLRGAYGLDVVESLTRTVEFDRPGRTVTITDAVRFREPATFATALVSYGAFAREGHTVTVTDGEASATVAIAVTGADAAYSLEVLEANWQSQRESPPNRLGIACARPVLSATITCVVRIP